MWKAKCLERISTSKFNFIQQKSSTSNKWGMNANGSSIQWRYKPRLNEVKPPADVTDFFSSELDKKSGRKFDGRI